jgi:WD40 repeat protein
MKAEQPNGIVIDSVGRDLSFQAGGDIVAGNKTIINNIIHRIAKELTTTPYKFLASYEIADRDIFYGRDAVIEELAAQVGRHKVILINGASGAGKSSLVNAGLIPRVVDNGYTFVAFREYSDPLEQLKAYFETAHNLPVLTAAEGEGLLLQMIRGFGAFPLVILLDQFERFFVRVADDKRRAFTAAFNYCLQHSDAKDLCFVLALRREFLGQLTAEFEEQIPDFLNESYRVNLLALSRADGREAVLRPLESTRLRIQYDENFVDDALLAGLAEQTSSSASIDPPHLQIVCNQLFEAARERLQTRTSVLVDRELYNELGGAQNILKTYLDKVVEDVAQDPTRIAVVHSILKAMIDAGTNTRTFVAMEGFKRALPDVNETEILRLIEKLLDRRVVEERKLTYSLSHEHMVGKVKEWFDPRELERKRAEETLNRGMMEWKNSGALLNRGQVERIRKWLPDPAEEEHQLLRASEEKYHEEERREDSRKRFRKISLYGAAAFTLIVMILGTFSFFKMREAVSAQDRALTNQARVLAALAKIEAEQGSLTSALRAALTALPRNLAAPNEPYALEAEGALLSGLLYVQELRRFGHEGRVYAVAFSPDGRTLATGSDDGAVQLWEVETGRKIRALRGHSNWVSSVAFSPDGHTLATGSADRSVRLWEAATGHEIAVLRGHTDRVLSAAFSPDGRTLATGSEDQTARLWEVATGREIRALRGHESWVSSVAFSPDGHSLATGSADKSVRLWAAATGHEIAVLRGHTDRVLSAAFSPDGRTLATGSEDQTARLWEVAKGREIAALRGHKEWVSSVAFSPDGRTLATGSWDKTARLWEVAAGREIAALRGHEYPVSSVVFSPDGRTLATGSWDKTARLWEVAAGREIRALRGHESSVFAAAFSPDGRTLATGSADTSVRLWEAATGREIAALRGHKDSVPSVAFSPDGHTLATGSEDKTSRLWEVETGREIRALRGHENLVLSVAFSPDGRTLVTGSKDKTARLWEVATGRDIAVLHGHGDTVYAVAFSPDGRSLASGSEDKTARLWEVAAGREIAAFRHQDGVLSVAFSPDGRTLATGSGDRTARLWEVATGREIAALRGHDGGVYAVAFSPDGRTLATVSTDKTARLWVVETGREIAVLRRHEDMVYAVAFSPDGRTLATGSGDKTVQLWPVGQALIDRACARVHDLPLNDVDKQRFGIQKEWCTPEVSAELLAKAHMAYAR